jgi:hypothetical protein
MQVGVVVQEIIQAALAALAEAVLAERHLPELEAVAQVVQEQ